MDPDVTPAFALLAARAARGDWADLDVLPEADRVLRAGEVRDLLLSIPLPRATHLAIADRHPEYAAFVPAADHGSVRVSSAGVRVRGARIVGVLDLTDGTGMGGASLPALALEDCRLEGAGRPDRRPPVDAPVVMTSLDVSNARLSRLSLRGSRTSFICARHLVVDGPLDLSGLAPLHDFTEQPWPGVDREVWKAWMTEWASWFERSVTASVTGEAFDEAAPEEPAALDPASQAPWPEDVHDHCWVDLTNARIAGNLILDGVRLRTPPPRPGAASNLETETVYALALMDATLGASLMGRAHSVFEGGITVSSARIAGDLWLAASLRRAEGRALSAYGAQVGGFLNLSPGSRTYGVFWLHSASIGRSLVLERDVMFDGAGGYALMGLYVDVGGDVRALEGFAARGGTNLYGAQLRGDLEMVGARVASGSSAVVASNANVRGDLLFGGGFAAKGGIKLYGTTVAGNLETYGARIDGGNGPAVNADMARIAGIARMSNGFLRGSLRFYGATVGAGLAMLGAKIDGDGAYAIQAEESAIDAFALLSEGFATRGGVRFFSATIGGNLDLHGAHLDGADMDALNASQASITGSAVLREGFTAKGRIGLYGATIGGNLDMDTAQIENPDGDCLSGPQLSLDGSILMRNGFTSKGRIRLFGAAMSNLAMDGAKLDSAADRVALDCEDANIKGSALLRAGFTAKGSVRLFGTTIRGDLEMSNANLDGGGASALIGRGMWLQGSALLRDAFETKGLIDFYRAVIDGNLNMRNAKLDGAGRIAFSGIQLTVRYSAMFSDFRAKGAVALFGAKVGSNLEVTNAQFGGEGERALDLRQAEVGRHFRMVDNRFAASIDLDGCTVGTLDDTSSGYTGAQTIALDGFRYERLAKPDLSAPSEPGRGITRSRVAWLARNHGDAPGPETFAPQPYRQLALVLDRQGLSDDARAVRFELRRASRRHSARRMWRSGMFVGATRAVLHLSSGVFGLCFGYGLKPERALLTLVAYFLLGWGVFAWANARGAMVIDLQPVANVAEDGAFGIQEQERALVTNLPCGEEIQPAYYALDVLIPLVDLRQEEKCEIGEVTEGALWQGWALPTALTGEPAVRLGGEITLLHAFKVAYAILGWVVISLAILTFSGLIERARERE